ncbi:unnamed protein product [Effrenium voratum]|nr:unnamed protein product [Effrenium voratum]
MELVLAAVLSEAKPSFGKRRLDANTTVCLTTTQPWVPLPQRQEITFDVAAVIGGASLGAMSMVCLFGVHKILRVLRDRGDGDVWLGLKTIGKKRPPKAERGTKRTLRMTGAPTIKDKE